jgi:hypothetical protein
VVGDDPAPSFPFLGVVVQVRAALPLGLVLGLFLATLAVLAAGLAADQGPAA